MHVVLKGFCVLAVVIAFGACSSYGTDCANNQDCSSYPGGSGGAIASAGTSGSNNSGGSSASAGSSGSDQGGGASAEAGEAGLGGVGGESGGAPCDGACAGGTPACDTQSNTCVECLEKSDCKAPKSACDTTTHACVECTETADCADVTKPLCDTSTRSCVECLKPADCTSATASACDAGQCKPCSSDAECSSIAGKGVCNAGTCVQCTVGKETACGGNACNPATTQCTTTPVGTLTFCQPCVADSECIGGNQVDPDTRCVPMKFMGAARAGGFCLRRFAKSCSRPFFKTADARSSLSGASAEPYCSIDEDSTRCEAVLDLIASQTCPDGKDTSCGCARDATGACTEAGQGALCKTVLGVPNSCTIPCGNAIQCTTIATCPAVANSYCQ